MADFGSLSAKQQRGIAALLVSRTIQEATEMAEIGERTLYRWLNIPAFQQAMAEAEAEAIGQAVRLMSGWIAEAVAVLVELLEHPEPKERRLAAIALLDHLPKLRLLTDLEERLNRIESLLNDNDNDD